MRIIAIDPGNIESAYVILDQNFNILDFGKADNNVISWKLGNERLDIFVIEMIASYGMAVGKEVFDTCVWIGRFWEVSKARIKDTIYRKEEKINICGSMKAKDSNIRQALIDRFAKHDLKNGKGTKKNPDTFYGFKSDIWAAMAVGVTYIDKLKLNDLPATRLEQLQAIAEE